MKDTIKDPAKEMKKDEARDANRDPITKTPGAHPVGTGIGATAGGLAGAAAGAAASAATGMATGTVLGGPVGAAVGLVAGAVIGGLAGKAAGEAVNPTKEDEHWRSAHRSEPYYNSAYSYDDYSPAYRTGYEGVSRYSGKSFDQIESQLEQDYTRNRGQSKLSWNDARQATRSAWDRVGSSSKRDQRETALEDV